jgi:hypothetical protein
VGRRSVAERLVGTEGVVDVAAPALEVVGEVFGAIASGLGPELAFEGAVETLDLSWVWGW